MWFPKLRKLSNPVFCPMTRTLQLTFFVTILLSLSGCFTASPEDSRMPQSRPASWEYSLPGGFDRGNR